MHTAQDVFMIVGQCQKWWFGRVAHDYAFIFSFDSKSDLYLHRVAAVNIALEKEKASTCDFAKKVREKREKRTEIW